MCILDKTRIRRGDMAIKVYGSCGPKTLTWACGGTRDNRRGGGIQASVPAYFAVVLGPNTIRDRPRVRNFCCLIIILDGVGPFDLRAIDQGMN